MLKTSNGIPLKSIIVIFSFELSEYPINCFRISESSSVLNSVKSAFLGFNKKDNLSSLIFVSSLGTNLSNSFA
jgi:hypothetical protein